MKTAILLAVLFASAAFAKPQPGLPFLLIWPTARSTALAGAMTGLGDDPDAAFFNPAGLAFQNGIGATANYVNWLPGLLPDLHSAYSACRWSPPIRIGDVDGLAVALDVGYLNLSDYWIYNYEFPDRLPDVWDGVLGASISLPVSRVVGAGLKVKLVHSSLVPEWVWKSMPGLGIEAGGTGSTWAVDIGVLWRPSTRFSLGGSLANLGPGISYPDRNKHDPSPAMLRMGACWTPVSSGYVRLNVLPEFDKLLAGMFFDTADTKTLGQELQTELRDAWKALGIEVTGLGFATVRLGYFEDISWERGGIVFERDGAEYRHNLYDLMTRRNLGKFKSIGLCWGFGIGYKDYFRFDVSSDAAIYDFPTTNWKFSLVANDIAGGIREIRQGHAPWEG